MDNDRVSHNATRAGELAEVLKAMAHPIRLRVVAILCEREANVTELTEALEIPQSQVSQQLRILRMANLVDVTRAGGYARYRLGNERLRSLIGCLEGCRGQREVIPVETDEA
jgi:DNA-binding transcriptional ArsR family regulator